MFTQEQLDDAIRAAGHYLTRQCGENGQFEYRVNLDPSVNVKPRYNLVRHAGAIYALALYGSATNDDAARLVVSRACQFLQSHIAPISPSSARHAVWSHRGIEGRRQRTQCKLGATGLALVALSSTKGIDGRLVEVSELAALAEFILFMQKNSGKFYSKYYPRFERRSDKWTSLYYPGEAALGLLMAHQQTTNSRLLQAAERALFYLAKQREGRFPVAPDHWALIATAEYFRINQVSGTDSNSHVLLQHAVQISESMLFDQLQAGGAGENRGWFTADRRTTPTATRIEGLLAILRFLPESTRALRHRVNLAVARGMQFLLRSQVGDGPFIGGIPRAICSMNSHDPTQRRSRTTEIRIDYVQHVLCAMIQFREIRVLSELTSIGGSPIDLGVCQIDVGQF